MLIRGIGEYLASLLPRNLLEENLKYTSMREDGLRFGDDRSEVTGVLICWMPTCDAITYAADNGCNVVICHEDLFYQGTGAPVELSSGWLANRKRVQLLAEKNITVYRSHSPLDVLYNTDAALDALNLEIQELRSEWIARVALIKPITVHELTSRVALGWGAQHARYTGTPERVVSNVGISIGGMGLSVNSSFQEWLRRLGAEAIITGEFDDYSACWAAESDVTLIAASHALSENPGIKRFYEQFERDFEHVPTFFYECNIPVSHFQNSGTTGGE